MELLLKYGAILLRLILMFVLHFNGQCCFCQQDSAFVQYMPVKKRGLPDVIFNEELLAPIGFISYGIASVKSPYLQKQNYLI